MDIEDDVGQFWWKSLGAPQINSFGGQKNSKLKI